MKHLDGAVRNREIVDMRDERKTLREIGDAYGISHERVRQILKKEGRADLCCYFHKIRICKICGKGVRGGLARIALFRQTGTCSTECSKKARWLDPTYPPSVKAIKFLRMRAEGKTWAAITREIYDRPSNFPTAWNAVKTWGDRTGIDVSWAYGPGSHNRALVPVAPDGFFKMLSEL